MYFSRLLSHPPPWTEDRVLAGYRFTNAYRAADRVSQFLIRHVIYPDGVSLTPEDILLRLILFKLFNKIDTWRLLEKELGPISLKTYDISRYDSVLSQALQAGRSIYSAAYIMPPPRGFPFKKKHKNHLVLLETMMRDSLCRKIGQAAEMENVYELLKSYPGIGEFLAYQLTIDINYSELTDFSEDEFVVAGPGATDGIRKVFRDTGGVPDADVVRIMAERQDAEFSRLGLEFRDLFGRPLQLIDCQNLFCEVGKYSRVAYPQYSGSSKRTRIKQEFAPRGRASLPRPWFPPKWNLNAKIAAYFAAEE